jgi:malate/lactate dehydrogenase
MVASSRYFSIGGIPLDDFARAEGVDQAELAEAISEAKKGGTHFVNETGQSASAGPARAAVEMLRCVISGESEVQPVVSILEKEYGLIEETDGLDSIAFGVPARIGPYGVEKIYELPVDDIRDQLEGSADFIKDDIKAAKKILKEKFQIE